MAQPLFTRHYLWLLLIPVGNGLLLQNTRVVNAGGSDVIATLKILGFYEKNALVPLPSASSCVAGSQVAIDGANSNSSFLPNYKIEGYFMDEGSMAANTPRNFVAFLDQDNKAPAVVGPYFTCQAVSGIIRNANMVQYTAGCGGSLFTANRKRFPNLYRNPPPLETYAVALYTTIALIGKWKRIGIVHGAINQNELRSAIAFYNQMSVLGIETVWFYSVLNMDEAMVNSLKSSKVRIIVSTFFDTPTIVRFFCFTYDNNIRAPQYSFVAFAFVIFDPLTLPAGQIPSGCRRETLAEQAKATLWFGRTNVLEAWAPSIFGYDPAEFESRVDKLTNKSRVGDYDRRYACHGSMTQALLAMSKADKILRENYNLTLASHSSSPEIVMDVLNKTTASMKFLDFGVFYGYSTRIEREFQTQFVYQLINGQQQLLAVVKPNAADVFDFYQYNHVVLRQPVWDPTLKGQPTKDLSEIITIHDTIPDSFFWTVVGLVSVTVGVQMIPIFRHLKKYKFEGISKPETIASLMLLSGSFAADGVAVVFLYEEPGNLSHQLCSLRISLLLASSSLISASLFVKTLKISGQVRFEALLLKTEASFKASNASRLATTANRSRVSAGRFSIRLRDFLIPAGSRPDSHAGGRSVPVPEIPEPPSKAKVMAYLLASFAYVIACVVLIAAWLANLFDAVSVDSFSSEIVLDHTRDAYIVIKSQFCSSREIVQWTILVGNGALLAFSAWKCYVTSRRKIGSNQSLQQARMFIGISVFNAAIIFAAILFLSAIVRGGKSNKAFQNGIWSIGVFVLANSTAVIYFYRKVQLNMTV